MKSIWYSILASIFLLSCNNKNNNEFSNGNLSINFNIDELDGQKVVLELVNSGRKHTQLDTIESEDGKGTFKVEALKTAFYQIYIPGQEGEVMFVGQPGDFISISGKGNNLYASSKIGGTPENDRLDSLVAFIKSTKFYTDSLKREFKKAEKKQMHFALLEEYEELYGNAKRKEENYVLNYVLKNPSQFSNLLAVSSLHKIRHKKVFQIIDSALINNFPQHEDVDKFHDIITEWYSSDVGKKAPNFTLLNPKQEAISLSDYKGKYVLLDFWNTGCRPCIQEIPNLKRIQNEFGGDKFEIISVCIDRKNPSTQEVWKKINEKYETNWTQVYDAGGLATLKNYKIKHYPTMMILDPNGKIIDAGDHIRGEKAYEIVKKLVGNE
ncbi:MAG: hypothetical protein CMP67_03950 [Flavobacteriales bacterium]|nr:hypothetical protein [Flavobacteriales bacterium]MBO73568.1 hypothetical protein [Flavobacteriales bacterium]|tara:strand:- start:13923 stop:15065 length:1143 start_codon:yes stop_codon:yes gene_type:complete